MTILTDDDVGDRLDRVREETINVADARKRLSALLRRVASGKATILIMRRGRPMARLIALDNEQVAPSLATVRGWLPDDHPLLAAVEESVTGRIRHRPRGLSKRTVSRKR